MKKLKLWLMGGLVVLLVGGCALNKEEKKSKAVLPWVEEGKIGRCLKFSGGKYFKGAREVKCGNKDALNISEAITMAFWVKGEAWENNWEGFVCKQNAYAIAKKEGLGGGVYFWVWIKGRTIDAFRDVVWPAEAFKLKENRWYHIAFTYNSQTALAKAYLDGKLMATSNLKEVYPGLPTYKIDISTAELVLGSSPTAILNGYLDEVYIYNCSLADNEIERIYRHQNVPRGGLVGLWKFEEGQGRKAADLSGKANAGYIEGGRIIRGKDLVKEIVVNGIVLARKGKIKTEIVVDKNAFPITKAAAVELQYFLGELLGLDIPLVEAEDGKAGIKEGINPIFVGENYFTRKLGISTASFKPDEYRIFTSDNSLVIIGRDDRSSKYNYTPRRSTGNAGTLYGVYGFLEALGMRWYFPGETGVVFPQKKKIVIKNLEIKDHPYFVYRYLENPPGVDSYWLRRIGGGGTVFPGASGHPFTSWHTKYKKEHPEYFALLPGGNRGDELCYYNPGTREQILKQIRDFFSTCGDSQIYPDFTILRLDGAPPVCTCPECGKRVRPSEGKDGSLSDYITEMTIDLADAIKKEFPDRSLRIAAYNDTTLPPVTIRQLPANVSVGLHKCALTFWSEEVRSNFYEGIVEGWVKLKPQTAFFFEYYNYDCWGGGKWLGIPCIANKFISEDFKRLKTISEANNIPFLGELVFTDGRPAKDAEKRLYWLCPTLYVTAKLLWNPDLSPDALMEDFYENFFGPAKEPMKRFYRKIEEVWTSGKWGKNLSYQRGITSEMTEKGYFSQNPWENLFTQDILKELTAYIIQAKKAARSTPYKERVEMIAGQFDLTLSQAGKYQGSKVSPEELEKANRIW